MYICFAVPNIRCAGRDANNFNFLNVVEDNGGKAGLACWRRLKLVLQEEEVVGGRDGDDVLRRVPGSVEDLLVEVQTVDVDLVLLAFAAGAHLKMVSDRTLSPAWLGQHVRVIKWNAINFIKGKSINYYQATQAVHGLFLTNYFFTGPMAGSHIRKKFFKIDTLKLVVSTNLFFIQ